MAEYLQRHEKTLEKISAYDEKACAGQYDAIYQFGENVLEQNDVDISRQNTKITGLQQSISLEVANNYPDFC